MEVYYKDLISKETSLEKLVDDLVLLVQGTDECAEGAGAALTTEQKQEITEKLHRIKESCRWIRRQAIGGAVATDKAVREYPYSSLGIAFGTGLVAGGLIMRALLGCCARRE